MSNPSRRKWLTAGIGVAAGAAGLAAADRLAKAYGLIPPTTARGLYGLGETLTYASQRLLTSHSMAREFRRDQISSVPFVNEVAPLNAEFKRHQAEGFAGWRLAIDGMVSHPAALSLADIRSYPSRSQITHLACEEGWSYIAQWTGVPLSHVLNLVGASPQSRYVIYFSQQKGWWDSIDMADAMHPQTFLAYGLNGGDLPIGNGGPLRMRVPRQLGYKSVKYVNRITVTDSLKKFPPEGDYSWYAGI